MNIFFLSWLVHECASFYFDRHVVKMILETAQLLCTAHWETGSALPHVFYRSTHKNHPSAVWVRAHRNNYQWVAWLGIARRYKKNHACELLMMHLAQHVPPALPNFALLGVTLPVPQAMPEELRTPDAVLPVCQDCKTEYAAVEHVKRQEDNVIWWTCAKCKTEQTSRVEGRGMEDAVEAYRRYYQSETKAHLTTWKEGQKPGWFE